MHKITYLNRWVIQPVYESIVMHVDWLQLFHATNPQFINICLQTMSTLLGFQSQLLYYLLYEGISLFSFVLFSHKSCAFMSHYQRLHQVTPGSTLPL